MPGRTKRTESTKLVSMQTLSSKLTSCAQLNRPVSAMKDARENSDFLLEFEQKLCDTRDVFAINDDPCRIMQIMQDAKAKSRTFEQEVLSQMIAFLKEGKDTQHVVANCVKLCNQYENRLLPYLQPKKPSFKEFQYFMRQKTYYGSRGDQDFYDKKIYDSLIQWNYNEQVVTDFLMLSAVNKSYTKYLQLDDFVNYCEPRNKFLFDVSILLKLLY